MTNCVWNTGEFYEAINSNCEPSQELKCLRFQKMLPVIPLNDVQKLLLVTKLAQSYWKKRKKMLLFFPYLIWCKIYKLHNKSTQVNSTKQSTRTVGLSTKFNWLRFSKNAALNSSSCSKNAQKLLQKRKKIVTLFLFGLIQKCTNCITKVRFRNIFLC